MPRVFCAEGDALELR